VVYPHGIKERTDEARKEGRRVVGYGLGATSGAGQVRCVDAVVAREGWHDPPPIESIIADAVQQQQRKPFSRCQITGGQTLDFDFSLLSYHR
jgi:hypothetical protein